jgi:hypothetical protein
MKARSASSPSTPPKAGPVTLRRRYVEYDEVPESVLAFLESDKSALNSLPDYIERADR